MLQNRHNDRDSPCQGGKLKEGRERRERSVCALRRKLYKKVIDVSEGNSRVFDGLAVKVDNLICTR